MTDDLLHGLEKAVLDGDEGAAATLARRALDGGMPALAAIEDGLAPGIREAGRLFEEAEFFLPEGDRGAGDEGRDGPLRFFDQIMQPSELAESRQTELRRKFQILAEHAGVETQSILFRKGDEIGANACALPSGIIVFTDEIVAMAHDDRELLAVFAHELGHVKHRHTMQHVLQNSVTGLLVIMLTGDIGTASSLAAALPTLLVQTKFSRDFEMEADDFAIDLLKQHGIAPTWLGDILQRMEKQMGGNGVPNFLSTHPATDERTRKFNGMKHD